MKEAYNEAMDENVVDLVSSPRNVFQSVLPHAHINDLSITLEGYGKGKGKGGKGKSKAKGNRTSSRALTRTWRYFFAFFLLSPEIVGV